MTPEIPLLAVEWGRSGSQCSPGISIGLPDVSMPPPAAPLTATLTVATGRQSQLATLHCPGRTASIAGASIGQALLNRRCSSEGTVQVVVTAPGMPTSPRLVATGGTGGGVNNTANNGNNATAPAAASQDNNNTAQPANSAADNVRGGARPSGFRNGAGRGGRGGGGGIEPEDSTTALSHAAGHTVAATAKGALALGAAAAPSNAAATARATRPAGGAAAAAAAAAIAAAKPTDSYSSAAVNAVPHGGDRNHDRAGNGGAASLASHHHHHDNDHGGVGSLDLATAAVDDDIRQTIDMPAPPLPSTTQPQNAPSAAAATTAAAAAAPAAAGTAMLTPATRMGNGVLLTPGHGLTPLQIQSVVSAALGRAGPLTARPGDSSSSGNRPLVLVGLKRKKPPTGVGRPPMAPPAQIPRTNANNNTNNNNTNNNQGATGQAQPTASSPGFAPQQADNTLAVEDAVSMVEHGLETADIEVACDAVSKASQGKVEDQGAGTFDEDDGGFIGSGCPSLAGPGVSLASAG